MRATYGSAIALLLLFGYLFLLIVADTVISCVATVGCTKYTADYFNDNMTQALSVIGGLVSALVIAELAATKPGEAPGAGVIAEDMSNHAKTAVKIVSVCYVLAWLGAGTYAFYVSLLHPKALPVITNLGQSWLGLAVASSYAYFGVKPQ